MLYAGALGSALTTRDGEPDELRCAGRDRTSATVDAVDVVLGCGRIDRTGAATPRFVFGTPLIFGERPADVRPGIDRFGRRLRADVACSSDMPAPCAARVVLRDGDGVLFDLTGEIEPGSYRLFERSVTRRNLGRRTYALRLEGTDATGAPVALEERGLRLR